MFAIRQTPRLLGRLVAVMMLVLILGGGLLAVPRGQRGWKSS